MLLTNKKIGFALTGSFSALKKTIPQISRLIEEGAEILPIMSFNAYSINSRFGNAKDFIQGIENMTGKQIIHTIEEAEPIGIKRLTDIMVIAPCSRKYNSKDGKWNYRYASFNSGKVTFKK